MNYRYHLLKYSGPASRLTCPECGRKNSLVPYVDENNNIVGPKYGRCNHESSCGYIQYPPNENYDWRNSRPDYYRQPQRPIRKTFVRPQPKPEPPGGISIIPEQIVQQILSRKNQSDFHRFLLTIASADDVQRVSDEYRLGVTKTSDVIYLQFDLKGRCRTGKIMRYNPETGHRIKDEDPRQPPVNWIHPKLLRSGRLPQGWELCQCLFGEHLLSKYPDKPVCLVEAEKTAIIGALLCPSYIWVATGGKGHMNDRVEVLHGRTIIAFPDVDGYQEWVTKAAERPYLNIQVSDILEKTATDDERSSQIDIADRLIAWQQSCPVQSPPQEQDDTPSTIVSDNPVFLEVKKYFSPEHHQFVHDLIEELDLELVSVSQTM